MFKLLKLLVMLVIILVIGAAVAGYFGLEYVVKHAIQGEGTAQLGVPVTLDSDSLGLSSVGLKGLTLCSPAGFTAPQMLTVNTLTVATPGLTHLTDKPLHVTLIAVDGPHLVLEQKGRTLNIRAMTEKLPGGGEPSPSTSGKNPLRLIIDKLTITHPTVLFQPDAGSLAGGTAGRLLGAVGAMGQKAAGPMNIDLPELDLTNIGNTDGKGQGAEVKDIMVAVIQAMAAKAAQQNNLPIDPSVLGGNLSDVQGKLRGALQDQIQQRTGGLGGLLNKVTGGGK